ncbi:hypothetical protein PR048_001780, partial [Dryococelus australis]
MHSECGHYGVTKTVKYIQNCCVFRDMYRTVDKIIRSVKYVHRAIGNTLRQKVEGGKIYIVILDKFTKFVKLYPIQQATAQVVTEKDCCVLEVGQTRKLFQIMDHNSVVIIRLCYSVPSAANPVERVMRELRRLFRTYCNEHHSKWAVI